MDNNIRRQNCGITMYIKYKDHYSHESRSSTEFCSNYFHTIYQHFLQFLHDYTMKTIPFFNFKITTIQSTN